MVVKKHYKNGGWYFMRIKGVFILFACLLFLSMSNCQAEERKDEWKNPSFNFRTIKTILVNTSIDPKAKMDEFDTRKLDLFYANAFFHNEKRWGKNNFQFITLNQLKERISKATGEDMERLAVEDQVRYKSEMDLFTPIIADAILNSKVTSFGYDQRFVAESYSTYTEQVETEIYVDVQDSTGKWTREKKIIRKPVERIRIIPAHYDTYGNAGMDYTLIDTKTNETIWMLRDIREAGGKNPIDMTERIIKRAAECLLKI